MSADAESLLGELTLEEKCALLAGVDLWHTAGCARLGLPGLKMSDGPSAVRGERWTGRPSASFPCGSALGATFDPELLGRVGRALGEEARDRGVGMVLGPTVNLHRHPLAGRNFECYSEDPHLSARLAVAYVAGLQSLGVSACVKHFAANDQEHERMTISAEVDERVMRELYLVPFEAVVLEARTWAVMSAYNRVGGTYCSEHPWLLGAVLKGEWGFDGVVVSDWFGTHSSAPAANAGLDIEMPGPSLFYAGSLAAAVAAGDVSVETLDEHVRRVLRLHARTATMPGYVRPTEQQHDRPEHRALARDAAISSFVLLRNEQRALPFEGVTTLALIGPNASIAIVQGGGSAGVTPHRPVSPLAGIRARAEHAGVELLAAPGCLPARVPVLDAEATTEGTFHVEYFGDGAFGGDAIVVEDSSRAHFTWLGPWHPEVPKVFSARACATVVVAEAGEHRLRLVSAGQSRVLLDGALVCDNWEPQGRSDAFVGFASAPVVAEVVLEAGEHALVVEYSNERSPFVGGLTLGWQAPVPDDAIARAAALAARCDAAVVVVGTDDEWESEGHDRRTLDLPPGQRELVEAVAAANRRTVVVVNAGAPVSLAGTEGAAAVLWGWFAGEEWGNALAAVLFGDADPGGRLPTTLPARIEDTPAYSSYPGAEGRAPYSEGLLMGYRWYDTNDVTPAFCFGHGLSFTTFDMTLSAADASRVEVTVTNTGSRRGTAVVQCYVHRAARAESEPEQVLAGFAKVALDAAVSQTSTIALSDRSFSAWSADGQAFVTRPGEYEIRVGASSRDVRARATVIV